MFYCNISNSGLRHISNLTTLQSLNLDSRDISDDGLKYLPRTLTSLDIFSGRITDTGCGHIAKICTALKALELCGGGIGDLGCTFLANLENLTRLNLSQNDRISNRGAAALATLTNLRTLNLSNTRVNGSALRFFSGLRKLQSLAIYGCDGVIDNTTDSNSKTISECLLNLQNDLNNLQCVRVHPSAENEGKMLTKEEEESSYEQQSLPTTTADAWMRRGAPDDSIMAEEGDAEFSTRIEIGN